MYRTVDGLSLLSQEWTQNKPGDRSQPSFRAPSCVHMRRTLTVSKKGNLIFTNYNKPPLGQVQPGSPRLLYPLNN